MLFTPGLRHESREFSRRMEMAFARKQQRERDSLPLFADQVSELQHSWEDEKAAREERNYRSIQNWRNFLAAQWRSVRQRYYALPAEQRAFCRQQWHAFWGKHTPSNLAYYVDGLNGERARRVAAGREETMAIRRRIEAEMGEQTALI